MAPAEKVPETSGSWYNWWTSPVITSGRVLGAVMLAVLAVLLFLVGVVWFSVGVPAAAVVCLAGAVGLGWISYRVIRPVL